MARGQCLLTIGITDVLLASGVALPLGELLPWWPKGEEMRSLTSGGPLHHYHHHHPHFHCSHPLAFPWGTGVGGDGDEQRRGRKAEVPGVNCEWPSQRDPPPKRDG